MHLAQVELLATLAAGITAALVVLHLPRRDEAVDPVVSADEHAAR